MRTLDPEKKLMRGRWKRAAAVTVLAAMLGGMTTGSASAQAIPPLPSVGPAIGSCAVLAGISPCLAGVTPASPAILVPGLGGDRNVHVASDTDRTRTPGRVVITQ